MITADELSKYILEDRARQNKLRIQEMYVNGRNPSILAPYPKEDPDNRIPVPFARRAVNMVCGYMFKEGNISYSGDGYDDALKDTFDSNDEGLEDLELARTALTHGEAWELHWTEGNKDQFAQVPISQCIAIYSETLKPKLECFIRHWQGKDKIYHADEYDESSVYKWVSTDGVKYTIDSEERHGYARVPAVRFGISHDGSNLFDHVTALIDFYDKIMSEDFANELAKFASSYLLTSGQISDEVGDDGETEIDKIKRNKMFMGLNGDKSVLDQIAFLTRNIPADFTEAAANRTERLIYEMLQLFNTNDDSFIQASGFAQEYKLLGFEYLCTTIATYISIGLQDRIALIKKLDSNLNAGNNSINTDVTIKLNRNLPDDLLQTAQIAAMLKGILSDETILNIFPSTIVEDKEEELKRIQDRVDIFSDQPSNTSESNGANNADAGA